MQTAPSRPHLTCHLTNWSLPTCSIFETRSDLSRQLVDTVVPQINSGSDQVIAHAGDDNSKLTQLSEELEQNLREEQQFNVQMLYAVFRFQLNPLQVCCLCGVPSAGCSDALSLQLQHCFAGLPAQMAGDRHEWQLGLHSNWGVTKKHQNSTATTCHAAAAAVGLLLHWLGAAAVACITG